MAIWQVRAGAGSAGSVLPTLAAAARRAQPGDVVEVAAGVYRERLECKTERVTWQGAGPGQSIIDGGWDGRDLSELFAPAVAIGGAGVIVRGFSIRNAPRGVTIGEAQGAALEDCAIDNTITSGLVLTGSIGVTVRRVAVTRAGMGWEAGRRPSVAGSVILTKAKRCLLERCIVAYGHGEGINIGKGSGGDDGDGCTVRNCIVFDNSHLCLYFNRCVNCLAEGNLLFLTGFQARNVGGEGWPAGVVFGDEGSENMQTNPHSRGNRFIGNVVVNCGTLLQVRNNAQNYDTQLDAATRIERNTFVAGPLTTVALQINANQAGRPHGPARVSGNVMDMTGAAAGADTVRGGDGLAWAANAWTRQPPAQARGAGDVVGPLGLARPDAALTNEFPDPGHSLRLDNYRPAPGSPLLDATGAAAFGALDPLPAEPPPPDEPPIPAPVDWAALIERAAAIGVQLATLADALDTAAQAVGVASLAHAAAANELGALLLELDECRTNK